MPYIQHINGIFGKRKRASPMNPQVLLTVMIIIIIIQHKYRYRIDKTQTMDKKKGLDRKQNPSWTNSQLNAYDAPFFSGLREALGSWISAYHPSFPQPTSPSRLNRRPCASVMMLPHHLSQGPITIRGPYQQFRLTKRIKISSNAFLFLVIVANLNAEFEPDHLPNKELIFLYGEQNYSSFHDQTKILPSNQQEVIYLRQLNQHKPQI